MSCKISIHEAAEIELNDVAYFYDIACVNLGSVFIDEVQRTIKTNLQVSRCSTKRGKILVNELATFKAEV